MVSSQESHMSITRLALSFIVLVAPAAFAQQAPQQEEPSWKWPESRWRAAVDKVRAGKRLLPPSWPGGAKVAVALSFDFDNETLALRNGQTLPSLLSTGEYGSRAALPRVLSLLEKYDIPATFFIPAVSAKLYPEEVKRIAKAGHAIGIHGWIHESNARPTGTVELPVEWLLDDYPYFNMDRFAGLRPHTPPSAVYEIWTSEFDVAYEEGSMFLLTMHPQIIGHRSRMAMLEKLVQYMRSRPGVWFATHEQVARHAKESGASEVGRR